MKKILLILAFTISLFGIDLEDFITKIGTKCIEPSRISFLGEYNLDNSGVYKKNPKWEHHFYKDGHYSCYEDKIKSLSIDSRYKGVLPYGLDFRFNKEEIIKTIERPYTINRNEIIFQNPNIEITYYSDSKYNKFNSLEIKKQVPATYSIDVEVNETNHQKLILKIHSYNKFKKISYIIKNESETVITKDININRLSTTYNSENIDNSFNINISSSLNGKYTIFVKGFYENLKGSTVSKTFEIDNKPKLYNINAKINPKNSDYLVLKLKTEDYKELNKVEYTIINFIDKKNHIMEKLKLRVKFLMIKLI